MRPVRVHASFRHTTEAGGCPSIRCWQDMKKLIVFCLHPRAEKGTLLSTPPAVNIQIEQRSEPWLLGVAQTASTRVTTNEQEEKGAFSEMHSFGSAS